MWKVRELDGVGKDTTLQVAGRKQQAVSQTETFGRRYEGAAEDGGASDVQ